MDKMEINLVDEAERIVSDYSVRRKSHCYRKKKQGIEFDAMLNVVLALSCIILAVVLGLGGTLELL